MESADHNITSSESGLSQTPPDSTADDRPLIYFAARLLRHVENMDAARAEVREATLRLKERPTRENRRRRAEAALVAHARAEKRLKRSAMRMREAVEREVARGESA